MSDNRGNIGNALSGERLNSAPPINASPDSLKEVELKLFFRYTAIWDQEAKFTIGCRAELVPNFPSKPTLVIGLRWYSSDGAVLVWETPGIDLAVSADSWTFILPEVPPWPKSARYLRFEVLVLHGFYRVPIARGLLFSSRRKSHFPDNTVGVLPEVIAMSASENIRTDAPPIKGPFSGLHQPYLTIASSDKNLGVSIIELNNSPELRTLVLTGCGSLGRSIVSARIPGPRVGAPLRFAIADEDVDTSGGRVFGYSKSAEVFPITFEKAELYSRDSNTCLKCGPSDEITAVVTSCGRQELLERTLDSFFKFNTYPLHRVIVAEDGPWQANAALMEKYKEREITWTSSGRRVGQIRSIDRAYSLVNTPYIFHFEDDWEFYASGFIEKSLSILEAIPECLQVWMRAVNDTNGHPLSTGIESAGGVPFRRLEFNYLGVWNGFSLNPGLRRKYDYKLLGKYGNHVGFDLKNPNTSEVCLGQIYASYGYFAAILADNSGKGYVRHIGGDHHIHS